MENSEAIKKQIELDKQMQKSREEERKEFPVMLQALVDRREYFEYADYSQYLLEEQISTDILILNDRLVTWIKMAGKESPKYKELFELNMAILRIDTYFKNIQTVCKAATVQVALKDKEIKMLLSKIKLQELENITTKSNYERQIKSLLEQINFLEKQICQKQN